MTMLWTAEEIAEYEQHRQAFNDAWRDHGFMSASLSAAHNGVPTEYVMQRWVRVVQSYTE